MATMTDQGRMVFLLACAFFLAAYVNGATILYLIAFFALALLLASSLMAWAGTRNMSCQRKLPDSAIFCNDPYPTAIILSEQSPRRRWLKIIDQHENLNSSIITFRHMLISTNDITSFQAQVAGESVNMEAQENNARRLTINDEIKFLQRGRHILGPIQINSYDPFGLCYKQKIFVFTESILVYPQALPVPDIVFSGNGGVKETEIREKVRAGETVDFFGVRPYVQGDDLRRIHWKSSAHSGDLMVKEYEFHSSGGIHIILDLQQEQHQGKDDFSSLEYAVVIATSLFNYAIRNGNQAGLLTSGEQIVSLPPDSGQRQLQRALEALALAQNDGSVSLDKILTRIGDIRSGKNTLMIITPSTDNNILPGILKLRANVPQVVLILLDSMSFKLASARKESVAAGKIARLIEKINDTSVDIDTGDDHQRLVQAARSTKINTVSVTAEKSIQQVLKEIRSQLYN